MAFISNGTTIASGGSLDVSASPPSTAGAIGSYAFLGDQSNSLGSSYPGASFGGTLAGSNLKPHNANGGQSGSTQSGTWRCMGYSQNASSGGTGAPTVCVWIRIS